jgi:hypothetical protein
LRYAVIGAQPEPSLLNAAYQREALDELNAQAEHGFASEHIPGVKGA